MTSVLRGLAVVIAILAAWDPAIDRSRRQPLPVDLRALPSPADPDGTRAERLRDALIERLGSAIEVRRHDPSAVVLIGGALNDALPSVPVSTLSVSTNGRNVRVLGVRTPERILPAQQVSIRADLGARAARGTTSRVILERNGIEIARAQHAWRGDEEWASVELPVAPMEAGLLALRVRVEPVPNEVDHEDNIREVAVRIDPAQLRVLVLEPRPSWAVTFIRRAIEEDPAFDVSAIARHSRARATQTGKPPATLSADALAPHDAVVVGAPEDLNSREVDALAEYLSRRGGAVVLVPDRPPSGAYTRLLPGKVQPLLLDRPVALAGDVALRGAELLVALDSWPNERVLAQATDRGRGVIIATPHGRGMLVFSGALDAWKFRDGNDRYARYWRGLVAGAALGTPPPIALSVEPAIAAPGDPLHVRLVTAPSENVRTVSAIVTSTAGAATPIRLWPTARAGEYAGELAAPDAEGRFDVRATAEGRTVDAVLVVANGVRSAHLEDAPILIPALTGGVAGIADEMAEIEEYLMTRAAPAGQVPVHPLRGSWTFVAFVAALCAEWTLKRRKGLR